MKKKEQPIFTQSHLLFDIEVKNMNDAFKQIAKKAKDLGVISNIDKLIKGLEEREKIGTTGMSESFAIPHASNTDVKYPCVIAARFKQPIDWKSVDGKPVKFVICLLIPKEKLSDLHVTYLSRVANALLDASFKEKLNTAQNPATISRLIKSALDKKAEVSKVETKEAKPTKVTKEPSKTGKQKKILVGVTACASGIAHTFMAKTAIEKYGNTHDYEVWIETHGQDGAKHVIPNDLIKKADYVIVASDIHVETDRFYGKRLYRCTTNEAINTPSLAFKNMEQKAVLMSAGSGTANPQSMQEQKGGFMKHFLSGVSRMIPFLVFSGIVYAILNAIIQGLYGTTVEADLIALGEYTQWAIYALKVAGVGFTFFVAIMGGFIAESIAGRAAFAPGMIASFVMGSTDCVFWYPGIPQKVEINMSITGEINATISGISLGIIAAIAMGFAAGYLVKLCLRIPTKPALRPLINIIFIPVVCTSALVFPYVFGLSAVFACAMNYVGAGIAIGGAIQGVNFLMGFLLGFMIGFDMGGPVNKIAVTTATSLIQIDPRFMGACACAIPIAPLATGLSCVMFRKLFDEEDFKNGCTALGLGAMGISEGAIPMFSKYPKQTFIANVIGGAVAGGLAFTFYVGGHVAMWGGPLIAACLGYYADPGALGITIPNVFGGMNKDGLSFLSTLWYFVALAGAVVVEVTVYYFLIRRLKLYHWKDLAKLKKRVANKMHKKQIALQAKQEQASA
ncbi:MAG: PTS sugar transporter subunit IIA [Malacoplasma sp.]|nr:PTS sugar transporter subunit IIA [Malacoplasma sp.]